MLDRSTYLGGHDASAILGLNPYRTPLDVYKDKKDKTNEPENYRMAKGKAVEPVIAEWYRNHVGGKWVTFGQDTDRELEIFHPVHPFLGGHPDGVIKLPNGEMRMVEIKDSKRPQDWYEGVPEMHQAQAEYYLSLLRENGHNVSCVVDFIADVGSEKEPRVVSMSFQVGHMKCILDEFYAWWTEHIINDIEPAPTNPAECLAKWPTTGGDIVAGTQEHQLIAERYHEIQDMLKILADEKQSIEVSLKRSLADAEAIVTPEGKKIATWKTHQAERLHQESLKSSYPEAYKACLKQSSYRRFAVPRSRRKK